ncbi:sensor histidine kinase [Actinophytocola gossypii]|uniref:Sensor histidine kinase n=1 Tax=Actinophytocola gossypii TaxID=2812003 RepID=A0ABT2J298_9PSEU|nr:histidine kinase [Actinophytocola gossypii]MCT2581987.1 sensor histidine kinase [Actinophytocola gossypii]
MSQQTDTLSIVLSFVYTVALLVLQLAYFSRPHRRPRPPLSYVALVVQAGLVYLPLLQYGEAWVSRPGFLAGSLLLTLHAAAGVPLFLLVVASMAWVQAGLGGSAADIAYTSVSTVITGLVVFGLTRLTNLVTELHAARNELAQLAVAKERLRFARDLHDLLGMSLSAITLKSELTSRLIADHPTRASEELTAILTVSRQALADVRSVASGYRELSLDDECDSAESVLATADVEVVLRRDYGEVSPMTGTLLATVLREGVTNVLRHSKAERCDIDIRRTGDAVVIEMVNDGASGEPGPCPDGGVSGSGLRNLCERLRAVHGVLVIENLPDQRFRLCATIPLPASAESSADTVTTIRHPWRFGSRRHDSVR